MMGNERSGIVLANEPELPRATILRNLGNYPLPASADAVPLTFTPWFRARFQAHLSTLLGCPVTIIGFFQKFHNLINIKLPEGHYPKLINNCPVIERCLAWARLYIKRLD